MKKVFAIVALVVVLCTFTLVATACPFDFGGSATIKIAARVTAEEFAQLQEGKKTLKDYLEFLAADDENVQLAFSQDEDAANVVLVTLFDGTANADKGEAWKIYSTSKTHVDASKGTCTYEDVTYTAVNAGVAVLPVEENVSYLFVLEYELVPVE